MFEYFFKIAASYADNKIEILQFYNLLNSFDIVDQQLQIREIINECDNLTEQILANSAKYSCKLLIHLNTKHNDDLFQNAFDIYLCTLNKIDNDKVVDVLNKIINLARKLQLINKMNITSFIWRRKIFRNHITKFNDKYNNKLNGFEFMAKSLFSSVTNDFLMITDLPQDTGFHTSFNTDISAVYDNITLYDIANCFDPLINNSDDNSNELKLFLIKYLNNIFNANIGYTYDEINDITPKLAKLDYCVLCFNILIKIMKNHDKVYKSDIVNEDADGANDVNDGYTNNNNEYNNIINGIFWGAIDVVLLSIVHIKEQIYEETNQISDMNKRNDAELKNHYNKGIAMFKKITSFISSIDESYINNKIYSTIQYLIDKEKQNNGRNDLYIRTDLVLDRIDRVLMRLVTYYSYCGRSILHIYKVPNIILNLIANKNIQIYVKRDCFRLIMSHDLKNAYFNLPNSKKITTNFIINDILKLKGTIKIFFMVDFINELSNYPIMADSNILEIFMYNIPEFCQHYIDLLKLFNSDDISKIDIIKDIEKIISMTALLIRNLPLLEKNSLSYINDILIFVETICDTKKFIQSSEYNYYDDNTKKNYENALLIFDSLKNIFIDKIKPFVSALLHLLKSNNKIILDRDSERILNDILNINILQNQDSNQGYKIKIIDDLNLPQELCDVIKCDLVINPYFIKMNNGDLQLIDRKTFLNIARNKIHPFTREIIDIKLLEEFNNSKDILKLRIEILEKIEKLYDSL